VLNPTTLVAAARGEIHNSLNYGAVKFRKVRNGFQFKVSGNIDKFMAKRKHFSSSMQGQFQKIAGVHFDLLHSKVDQTVGQLKRIQNTGSDLSIQFIARKVFGVENIAVFQRLFEAAEHAIAHFHQTPPIQLHRCLQLGKVQFECQSKALSNELLLRRELKGTVPPLESDTSLFHKYGQLADLAYLPPCAIRARLQELGLTLVQEGQKGGVEEPAYYIAFSPDTKECVLAIRGTNNLEDVVTDVLHTPITFLGTEMRAHCGIAGAASFINSRVLPLLQHLFVSQVLSLSHTHT
jgi:hypothetical protein